jgi:hypothetical protein
MAKARFQSIRVAAAFAVAASADTLQFFIDAIARHWELPGELADFGLDVSVSALLSLLMGFRLILLPSFIMKTIPSVDAIPTWTATVAFWVWSQKHQAENQPQTANAVAAGEAQPARETPAALSAAMSPVRPGSSGFWYLIAAAALLAGLICLTRITHDKTAGSAGQQAMLAWPSGLTNPIVIVGQVENQTPANSSSKRINPERIRQQLADLLRGIEGVEVLAEPQAQAFLSQWEQNPAGQAAAQNAAKLRGFPVVIVRATLLDMQQVAANFKGYGIAVKSLDTQCSLRLQVMNAADGSTTFSKTLNGSQTQTQTEFVQTVSTEDRNFEAVKAALKPVENDADFRQAVRGGKTADQVEVEFSLTPDHCDIEIDGHYVGGSPLKFKLPAGRETKVRLSKAGFKDWEGRLLPQAGLRVERELEPIESKQSTP